MLLKEKQRLLELSKNDSWKSIRNFLCLIRCYQYGSCSPLVDCRKEREIETGEMLNNRY